MTPSRAKRPSIPDCNARLNNALRLIKKHVPAAGEQRADLEDAIRLVVGVAHEFGLLRDHGDILKPVTYICGDCEERVLFGETHDCPSLLGAR